MRLRIQSRNLDLPEATRDAIARRLRLACGRHVGGIVAADITLSAEDGPRESLCLARLQMRQGGELTVEDRGDDPFTAAHAVAWRLEKRLDHRQRASR